VAARRGRDFPSRFATRHFPRRYAGGETVTRETDADSDVLRGKVKTAIERNLAEKGLKEANDPKMPIPGGLSYRCARRNMTVERVYPGVYPGLMCGPFGCYADGAMGRLPSVMRMFASAKVRS